MGKLNGLFLIQIHITLRAAFERLSKQPSPSHPSREGARVSLSEVDVDGDGVIRRAQRRVWRRLRWGGRRQRRRRRRLLLLTIPCLCNVSVTSGINMTLEPPSSAGLLSPRSFARAAIFAYALTRSSVILKRLVAVWGRAATSVYPISPHNLLFSSEQKVLMCTTFGCIPAGSVTWTRA